MAVKSLKNLDSFSRGYIEGRTTKVDFNTTLTGDVSSRVASVTISAGDTNVTAAGTNVIFGNPDFNGTAATGEVIISSGVVTGVNITNAGSGYVNIPSIVITTDGDIGSATGAVTLAPAVDNNTILTFTTALIRNAGLHNEITPQIGQVVSGPGIVGIPKVTGFNILTGGNIQITIDIAQTISVGTRLTISDTNSGLNEYELTGSTSSRSKEDLRIDQIVPSELLNYASDSNYDNNTTGGIKTFLDSYYKFMNTEQFVYKSIETFDDVVINNIATIRIPDPDLRNNRFFSLSAAQSSQFYDSDDNLLTVGNNSTDFDININNISIYNVDNLPSDTALENSSGRTLTIIGLPTKLNNKKIKVKTSIQTYVKSNPSFRLNTLEDALNINENDEELLNMMQREIAPSVNHDIKVNKRALYQRLIDFYRIRGSKSSIDTFFKLFFQDEEIDVTYPWDTTLKTSMGNWDPQSLLAANYSKQSSPIVASDAAADDLYGTSVSLDAITNLLAVGAPGESSDEGAVYVYTTDNNGSSYTQEQKIVSDVGAVGDDFGSVVSLSNNLIAISSPDDTAHDGGTADDSGTVEIWERVLTAAPSTFVWQYRAKLQGATGGLNFGTDISLNGDTLAVAVPGYVNADRSDGAVLIYKGVGSSWTLSQTIITPQQLNITDENGWGKKVVLRGDILAVTWPEANNNKGSVSIFNINHSTGVFNATPEAILKPDELTTGALFGTSIDIDTSDTTERICAVGAPGIRSVFEFEREIDSSNVSIWVAKEKIEPDVGQSDDKFGSVVKIYNNNILIGAPNSDGVGVTSITDSGLVYHYENDDSWVQKGIYSETQTANHKFGSAFDISRNHRYDLLVGSPFTSSGGHVTNFIRSSQVGKYLNNEGFLSDKQKLHDSEFYQKFSYVIKAGRNISQWKDTYNKLVHPAGFKYFGEILVVIKAVRDVLGDDNRKTTITEKLLDDYGNEITAERVVAAYSAAAAFRKTLSSMPGVQPGYIGDEDLGLLIEALVSVFSPTGKARPNRDAKLAIVALGPNGTIPSNGISIAQSGSGYNTAPTVSTSGGSGAVIETEINRFGEITNVIVKGGHLLTVSTPAAPTSFIYDSSADSSRTAGTKTGISTTTAGSGSNGVVTIVVAADNTITSVTATTAGTGYKVGDVITVAGSALDGGDDLLLTVNEVHSGSGYNLNSSVTVQALSEVANSGTQYAIGAVTNTASITLASNPLTVGIFYKITDLGDATDANFNTISTIAYQREKWKVGDIFQAATTGSSLTTTAKIVIAEKGISFASFSNKKYITPPIIDIDEPDAIDYKGDPLTNNVNATARFAINNEIPLDDTARLIRGQRYTIIFKGDTTDAQFNSLSFNKTQTTWNVGDTFEAGDDGTTLGAPTTGTVAIYNSGGKINGFRITSAGLGYINEPKVNIRSNSRHEKRVPDVIPVRIVTNGNDIQTVSKTGDTIKTTINRNNDYFSRKDYSKKAVLGTKKFNGEYNITQFSSLTIENVGESIINKNNINTTIQTTTDRNT